MRIRDAQIQLWGSGLPSTMPHRQVTSFTTEQAAGLMDEEEPTRGWVAEGTLDWLWAAAERAGVPVGDVLIWDERATMHRGAGDSGPDERRIMLRTIVYPN